MLDREHLGLVDYTLPAQRVRPPDPLLRGGPRDPRHRRPAGARGVHPRAVDRRARRRGRDPRRGRRPSGRRAPGQHARDLLPPGARGRATACTSCSSTAAGRCAGLSREFYFVRHGESVGERLRPRRRAAGGRRRSPVRARLGAGARARPAAATARASSSIVASPMAPCAGDRGGDRRGARPAGRAPTTTCSRSASPTRSTPSRAARRGARDR